VLPPTSGTWNVAELSKDQYPTRPVSVDPDGLDASTARDPAHTGTRVTASVDNTTNSLCLFTVSVYDPQSQDVEPWLG